MPMSSTRRRFLVWAPLLWTSLLALAGCKDVTGTTVIGKVTFDKEPLTSATVYFVCVDGKEHACNTQLDGSYELNKLPVGKAMIRVVTFPPMPPGLAKGKSLPATEIPANYTKETTSGLTFDVKQGPNQFDILLSR